MTHKLHLNYLPLFPGSNFSDPRPSFIIAYLLYVFS